MNVFVMYILSYSNFNSKEKYVSIQNYLYMACVYVYACVVPRWPHCPPRQGLPCKDMFWGSWLPCASLPPLFPLLHSLVLHCHAFGSLTSLLTLSPLSICPPSPLLLLLSASLPVLSLPEKNMLNFKSCGAENNRLPACQLHWQHEIKEHLCRLQLPMSALIAYTACYDTACFL